MKKFNAYSSGVKLDEVEKNLSVNDAAVSALNRRIQLLEVEKNQAEVKVNPFPTFHSCL